MNSEVANLLKLIAMLAIDYLRWMQLTPLVTIWALGFGMFAGILFFNNQEESLTALATLSQWIAGLPLVGERLDAWLYSSAAENGLNSPASGGLKAAALTAWSALSLVFMLIALAVNWWFGPFKPLSLKRKLAIMAMCCVATLAGFIVLYLADPDKFNAPLGNWLLTFSGITLFLLLVSAWCLSIAHVLGLARRLIDESRSSAEQGLEPHSTRSEAKAAKNRALRMSARGSREYE